MNEQLNKELIEALIKSRCEFPDIPKTKTGRVGSHSYKYADLGDIIPLVTPILNKNGLLLTQLLSSLDRGTVLVTKIIHKNGSYIESSCDIPTGNLDAQKIGAWISYMKRYSLCSILGVHPEDDLDGIGAEPVAKMQAKPLVKPAPIVTPNKPKQTHTVTHNQLVYPEFDSFEGNGGPL